MKILLDTHLLLWWLGSAALVSGAARKVIADPENQVFISAVTLWEIRLKQSVGKLTLPEGFEGALDTQSFEHLPLKREHTAKILNLPWHHRDPFDRMLIAQAMAENFTLMTVDEQLAAYGDAVHVVPRGSV